MNQIYHLALKEYWYELYLLSRKQVISQKDFKKQSIVIISSVLKDYAVGLSTSERVLLQNQLSEVSLEQFFNDRESKIQK